MQHIACCVLGIRASGLGLGVVGGHGMIGINVVAVDTKHLASSV